MIMPHVVHVHWCRLLLVYIQTSDPIWGLLWALSIVFSNQNIVKPRLHVWCRYLGTCRRCSGTGPPWVRSAWRSPPQWECSRVRKLFVSPPSLRVSGPGSGDIFQCWSHNKYICCGDRGNVLCRTSNVVLMVPPLLLSSWLLAIVPDSDQQTSYYEQTHG